MKDRRDALDKIKLSMVTDEILEDLRF